VTLVGDASLPAALALVTEWCGIGYPATPPLMTVGTVDADGAPDARSLLLSGVDEDGRLSFHTDSRSRKTAQLAADDRVVLTVVWPERGRQLVVAGHARPTDAAEADRAWAARSDHLRVLGWLNDADSVRRPVEVRTQRWSAFTSARPPAHLERPGWWVGYAVTPHRVTAWTTGPGRGSMRHEHRLDADGGWSLTVLPG
jgi:pyridoxamine 5'-phosphate oxidase